MAKALHETPLTFGVIQGGKEDIEIIEPKLAGKGPTGGDWLRDLGYGARFVCHPRASAGCWLNMYGIAHVEDACILLAEETEGGRMKFSWCNSKLFSNLYKLVAVLPSPDIETGDNNGRDLPRPADS